MTAFRSEPRAARPVPSSLRISREPLADRLLVDVLDDVGVDRRAGLRHRQQVGPGTRAAGDLGQRRRARAAGLAVDVALADQRLRADRAGGVGVERRELAVVDRDRDGGHVRWRGRRTLLGARANAQRLDAPDVRARDPHVLAADRERGVVEDRSDEVGPAGAARGARPGRSRSRRGPRAGRRSVRLASWAGRGVGGVTARHRDRRRAIRSRLDGAARTATADDVEAAVAQRRRLWLQLIRPVQPERTENRLGPRVVPVGVVVGGGLAQVGERGDDVRARTRAGSRAAPGRRSSALISSGKVVAPDLGERRRLPKQGRQIPGAAGVA